MPGAPSFVPLGELTARLYALFVAGDMELLEINPLAIDETGQLVLVGAMAGVEPQRAGTSSPNGVTPTARTHPLRALSPREARVRAVDADIAAPRPAMSNWTAISAFSSVAAVRDSISTIGCSLLAGDRPITA